METTPEGRQLRFSYDVSWVAIYMDRAGLATRQTGFQVSGRGSTGRRPW